MAKRSLILGDSLTFGRPSHHISYEDTWPRLLEHTGFKVFHRGIGGADSGVVLGELKHLHGYMAPSSTNDAPFDICLIQVGIVDCTPRLLPKRLTRIAKKLPVSRELINWLSRKRTILQRVGRPWINSIHFEKNILEIVALAQDLSDDVVFIQIAKPAHFLLENCGDFSALVDQYNTILREKSGGAFLPVYEDIELTDQFLPDGHHLTKIAHRNIAKKVLEMI